MDINTPLHTPPTPSDGVILEGKKGLRKKAAAKKIADLKKKEAILDRALKTSYGMAKLAKALSGPVKRYLDMKSIGRQLVVTDQKGQGEVAYFDLDVDQFPAVTVGKFGAANKVYVAATRVYLEAFEIGVVAKMPLSEITWRKYDLLSRTLERIRLGLGIKEDLLVFQGLDAASTTMNPLIDVGGDLSLTGLAKAFEALEGWPLMGWGIVMNQHAIADIRSWNNTNVDEVGRIQVRETGYLGNLWGANMFISRLVPSTPTHAYAYVVAAPEYVGYMPFWADSHVYSSNNLDDFQVGFIGWEMLGLTIWNGRAVAKVRFAL